MTVAQLMEKLLDMPGNAQVELGYHDSEYGPSADAAGEVSLNGDVVIIDVVGLEV